MDDLEFEDIGPQEGPQTFLLQTDAQDILYGGARGGGKTFGMILKWLQHHQMYGHIHPNAARGIIFRREIPQLDGFISECKGILPDLGWTFKAGKKYFVNEETGSHLFLRHMESDDDAAKYQGMSFSFVGIEELGDFPSETKEGTNKQILGTAVRKIKATLRSAYGARTQFMATANPGGKCHSAIKNEYIEPADPMTLFADPDTGIGRIYIPSLLENNQILMKNDPNYEKILMGSGSPWLVRAWRQGDWSVSPEGNAFKREFFKYYPERLPLSQYLYIVHSWDTAFKDKKNNDRSACTVWGITGSQFHLLHAWAGRIEFPALQDMVKQLAAAFPPHAIFIEDKASGISLGQQLKTDTRLPIIPVPVDQNKLARAYAVTPTFAAGKVFLPLNAPWVYEYIDELTAFPTRNEDDYVDSTSQAISRLNHYHNLLLNSGSNVVPLQKHSIYTL